MFAFVGSDRKSHRTSSNTNAGPLRSLRRDWHVNRRNVWLESSSNRWQLRARMPQNAGPCRIQSTNCVRRLSHSSPVKHSSPTLRPPWKRHSNTEFLLMKRFLTLAAVMAPLAFCALPSQAVPLNTSPAADAKSEAGLLTQVQWGRCGYWRRECTIRWPARGPRFFRCLAIHGC